MRPDAKDKLTAGAARSGATAAIKGHPFHAALVPFPIACFSLVLVTDIIYWQTEYLMWKHFSAWLLLAGIIFAVLASIAGAIDLLSRRAVRSHSIALIHGVGNVVVLGLAVFNSFIHARDGWPGVVPTGLILSAVTVLVMMVTVWLGREMVYRRGIGVRLHD
jgi:uncharacterized membrane protein